MKAIASSCMIGTAILAFGTTAWAGNDCATRAGERSLSAPEIRAKVEAQGYKIQRVERERGCYEVKARDQSGKSVELKVSAADGSLTEEHEDED